MKSHGIFPTFFCPVRFVLALAFFARLPIEYVSEIKHTFSVFQNLNDFVAECKERLNDILSSAGPIATSTPERSNQRTSLANENSVSSEPTNDATLKQNNSADSIDASWNAKSKHVHSRIEKLRGYGEPPPLSPISMCSRRRSSRLSIQTRVHKLSISKK